MYANDDNNNYKLIGMEARTTKLELMSPAL